MEQPLAPETALAPVQAPVRVTTPRDPQDVLQQILTGLGIEAQITADVVNGAPRFLINTADPGRLIGKHGQTLSQLQFLVNRILFRDDPNAPRVTVDCEGYRDQQTNRGQPNNDLLNQCAEAAGKVRRWGEEILIGPFESSDRQIIQEHFAADPEIEAISEGGAGTAKKKILLRIRQAPLHAPGQSQTRR